MTVSDRDVQVFPQAVLVGINKTTRMAMLAQNLLGSKHLAGFLSNLDLISQTLTKVNLAFSFFL
jgi:hypothetical protein